MNEYEKTTRFVNVAPSASSELILTIFDGCESPRTISLNTFKKSKITFGREQNNDIVLTSQIVSRKHGYFKLVGSQWSIEDAGSMNGLIYNDCNILSHVLSEGDFIRIDDGVETIASGVLFVFSSAESASKWDALQTTGKCEITIGRASGCDIILPHISVSKCHAKIVHEKSGCYIVDNGSTNGVIVNNKRISGKESLHEKTVITIANSKLIYTSSAIFYCCCKSGISVDASDIVIKRGKGRKARTTCDHVSLNIRPGELVAIVGGSGAGKSTILNCMCGYLKPNEGNVYINGNDLYRNFDSLKKLIGYVPQSDIVYDNLTLHDMLLYTAKLRLPSDTTSPEREAAISKAIEMVELTEKKNSLIKSLSGGQRKRASIAVELLSDPNLLFLDEPASGLDPGTERNLMQSLREMARKGKTVILVTHSTLQLALCDKIVFMGRGGNLCYFGPYADALDFFGVKDVVEIYNMISDDAKMWSGKFRKTIPPIGKPRTEHVPTARKKDSKVRQLFVLCARYIKLIANDRQRLLLLLLQAPILAILISFVADGNQFKQYEMTKSLLFALSCSAFWIGMLNAIQEVCKERIVLKREYMTGVSLSSYIVSKIVVLSMLCLLQSVLIVGVFAWAVGVPDDGLLFDSHLELLLTTFLTAIASSAMGLFVSSLFTNADRAMTVAPLLLMPQILFSGLIFKLDGATEMISWLAVCRWSMEGYGTTADLNNLSLKLQLEGIAIPHEAEGFFEFTSSHMLMAWGVLIAYVVIFLILARVVLSKIGKEKS